MRLHEGPSKAAFSQSPGLKAKTVAPPLIGMYSLALGIACSFKCRFRSSFTPFLRHRWRLYSDSAHVALRSSLGGTERFKV